jgi:outer membrane protein TolC
MEKRNSYAAGIRWPGAVALLLAITVLFCPAAAAAEQGEGVTELTLRDCIEIALRNNMDIEVARFDPQIAGTTIDQAWGAFDPSVYLSTRNNQEDRLSYFGYEVQGTEKSRYLASGYDQTLTPGTNLSFDFFVRSNTSEQSGGGDVSSSDSWLADGQLTVTQPLLRNFGRELNKRGIYIARNNLDISHEQFRGQVIDVLNGVQTAYWNLKYAIGWLEVQKQSLKRAQDLYELNKVKVEVGALPPIEITTAEAEVAARQVGIITAENDVREAKDTLRQVLNLAVELSDWDKDVIPVDDAEFSPVALDWRQELDEAMSKRPDLIQARLDLKNKQIEIDFRQNQVKPDLSLEAGYGHSGLNQDRFDPITGERVDSASLGEALKGMLNGDLADWYVGATFSMPLRNRTSKANHAAAKLEKTKAELSLRRLEQQVVVDVRSAIRSLVSSSEQVAASRISVRLAEEKLAAEQKKFENGLSTSYNVLLMQGDLVEQQNEYGRALLEFKKAEYGLEAAKGTLLEFVGVEMEPGAGGV